LHRERDADDAAAVDRDRDVARRVVEQRRGDAGVDAVDQARPGVVEQCDVLPHRACAR
jgi:hypothetical protein